MQSTVSTGEQSGVTSWLPLDSAVERAKLIRRAFNSSASNCAAVLSTAGRIAEADVQAGFRHLIRQAVIHFGFVRWEFWVI